MTVVCDALGASVNASRVVALHIMHVCGGILGEVGVFCVRTWCYAVQLTHIRSGIV